MSMQEIQNSLWAVFNDVILCIPIVYDVFDDEQLQIQVSAVE